MSNNIMKILVKAGMEARFRRSLESLDRDSNIISIIPPRSFVIDTKIKQYDLAKMTSIENVITIAKSKDEPLTIKDVKDFAFNDKHYNGNETVIVTGENLKDSYVVMKFDLKNNTIMIFPSNSIIISISDFFAMTSGFDTMTLTLIDGAYTCYIKSIVREHDCYILR